MHFQYTRFLVFRIVRQDYPTLQPYQEQCLPDDAASAPSKCFPDSLDPDVSPALACSECCLPVEGFSHYHCEGNTHGQEA